MTAPAPKIVQVTPAQRKLIGIFMTDGADPDTIAHRMGMRRGTVYNRFTRILERCELPNRTALALALERGQIRLRVHDGRADR